ncbi:putative flagellar hook-basal body complex protein [Oceanicola granulosus HTCC2516]|uniref:Putative flagellar hook-basal body complex protein n=1 Tax=Oceanicola granulosus (strain ATCC BAA-861 / DSM 15982 / KCTC 12143 / HTCC2516) TaxID=314256 RepID=Q2CDH3_OCEGH|nr:flagellar hook-basal body complex protein FliE [Oceanicola granulosus]EAR50738.1 putative flagellar hook-basal body complex protein [Oceanicola granulosus HTCC2516]
MNLPSSLVANAYETNRAATAPGPDAGGSPVGQLADDFLATLRASEETAMAAMTGDADPHALVQALAQTELALEAAVAVRNKVVEAYQEILRMPV